MARILHLLADDLPTGTAKQLDMLSQGLDRCGFEQTICSLEPNCQRRANLPSFAGRLTYCSHNWQLDPTFLLRLRRLLRQVRPELIQTWGDRAGSVGMWLAALQCATPIVRAVRAFDSESSYVPFLNRWLTGRVTRTIVNNDQLKNVLTIQGVPPQLIEVIVNAVEPPSELGTAPSLHGELGVDDSIRFVAVVGDLRIKKRIQDLIWAMDLLRVIHPQMHLLIMGEGEDYDRLRRFDRDVNLERCVHFLGRRDDVREVLSQCFCFWQASHDEGCSNAVLEALSVGLPVVASEIPGHKSIVVHGETGYIIPLGDCAEYARKTNGLLQNEQLRQSMGVAGRSFVQTHFTLPQMIEGYRNLYQSVLTSRAERAAMQFAVSAST